MYVYGYFAWIYRFVHYTQVWWNGVQGTGSIWTVVSCHVGPKSSRGAARVFLTRNLLPNLPLHHRVDLTNSGTDENFKGKTRVISLSSGTW